MRGGTLILVLSAVLRVNAAELRVDHVTVAGKDLANLRRMFADVGIPTEYGGKHSNGQTEMALSSFPDGSYLELIAPQPGADASSHYWWPFMAQQGGPCAWAIRAMNIATEARPLEAAGVDVRPTKSGRLRPDGVELRWEAANVGPGPQGSFFPFMIADETNRDLRAYPQGHPTTSSVSGVRFVVVGVRDLPGAIAKYRAAFGLGKPHFRDDWSLQARLAWFPGTPVVLATPAKGGTWLADRLDRLGEAPCAFVLGTTGSFHTGFALGTKWFSGEVLWLGATIDTPSPLGGMRLAVIRDK
jgi:hypothetical protein